MAEDRGGPAFPRYAELREKLHLSYSVGETGLILQFDGGATLLDYFAAATLQGLLADPRMRGTHADFAREAHLYARAMLAERSKPAQESSPPDDSGTEESK